MIDGFSLNTNNTKSIYEVKTLPDKPRTSPVMQYITSFLPVSRPELLNWI